MKKILVVFVIVALVFSMGISGSSFASENKPLENLSKGIDDVFYGDVEVPDNMNETGSKGTPLNAECTDTTKDDVGRGIARVVRGLYRIATFWYPEKD
jgi:hypothetical protein